jgi:hypothetical protein
MFPGRSKIGDTMTDINDKTVIHRSRSIHLDVA